MAGGGVNGHIALQDFYILRQVVPYYQQTELLIMYNSYSNHQYIREKRHSQMPANKLKWTSKEILK